MGEAIVAEGYQRIGFMGTKMSLDLRARKRFEGFTHALAKAGIEIADKEFYSGGSGLAKGREMTAEMLRRSPDLDFIYYSNDLIAAGGLLWCQEAGIDVPGKVGLAGFNGLTLLKGLPKQLATTDACRSEIGRAAAEIIARRSTETHVPGRDRMILDPPLQYGDTLRRGV